MIRLPNYAVILVFLLLLTACGSSPLLQRTEKDVAAVLQPVSKTAVTDGREEFRELYCNITNTHLSEFPEFSDCNHYLHKLSDEPDTGATFSFAANFSNQLRVIWIPGIFNGCFSSGSSSDPDALQHLAGYTNITTDVLGEVHGRAPSATNAQIIHEYLTNLILAADEKLVLVGFSKGTTDILHLLSNSTLYQPSIDKIDAVLSIEGVVNGTPLADDVSSDWEDLLDDLPLNDCPTQAQSGFRDLRRENQLNFMSSTQLPASIQYFSITGFTDESNISRIYRDAYRRLSMVDPRNDGQVIYYDAILPGSTLLGYANGDHLAITSAVTSDSGTGFFASLILNWLVNKNEFPREILLESAIRFIDSKL